LPHKWWLVSSSLNPLSQPHRWHHTHLDNYFLDDVGDERNSDSIERSAAQSAKQLIHQYSMSGGVAKIHTHAFIWQLCHHEFIFCYFCEWAWRWISWSLFYCLLIFLSCVIKLRNNNWMFFSRHSQTARQLSFHIASLSLTDLTNHVVCPFLRILKTTAHARLDQVTVPIIFHFRVWHWNRALKST